MEDREREREHTSINALSFLLVCFVFFLPNHEASGPGDAASLFFFFTHTDGRTA